MDNPVNLTFQRKTSLTQEDGGVLHGIVKKAARFLRTPVSVRGLGSLFLGGGAIVSLATWDQWILATAVVLSALGWGWRDILLRGRKKAGSESSRPPDLNNLLAEMEGHSGFGSDLLKAGIFAVPAAILLDTAYFYVSGAPLHLFIAFFAAALWSLPLPFLYLWEGHRGWLEYKKAEEELRLLVGVEENLDAEAP